MTPDARVESADVAMTEAGAHGLVTGSDSREVGFGQRMYKEAYKRMFVFPFTYEFFIGLTGSINNEHIQDRGFLLKKARCYLTIYGKALGIQSLIHGSINDDLKKLQQQHMELHELSQAVIIRPLDLPTRLREGDVKFGALVSMEDLGMNLENLRRVLRGERIQPSQPQGSTAEANGNGGLPNQQPEGDKPKPLRPFPIKEEDTQDKVSTAGGSSIRDRLEDEHITHEEPKGRGIDTRYDVPYNAGSVNKWSFHFK